MRYFFYVIAGAAFISWIVMFLVQHQGGSSHIYLLIAVAAIVINLLGADKMFSK